MHKLIASWITLSIAGGCAQAQTSPQAAPPAPHAGPAASPPAAAPAPSGNVDAILDALDERGKTLNDFTANVLITDTDAQTGEESKLSGWIWMQRLPGDDARLR